MGGGDKALRPLVERPMIAHVIARLRPQAECLALNANGDVTRFAPFGLPVIADAVPDYRGPLAGILAAMAWSSLELPNAEAVVTVPSDTPFLPDDLVARLNAAAGQLPDRIVLAASRGVLHQVVGRWPVALAGDLASFLAGGGRKVLDWANRHTFATATFADENLGGQAIDPFFNANTPEELLQAESWLRSTGANRS